LSSSEADGRGSIGQLQQDLTRVSNQLTGLGQEFSDHRKSTTTVHTQLQNQIWALEEARKRAQEMQRDMPTGFDMSNPQSAMSSARADGGAPIAIPGGHVGGPQPQNAPGGPGAYAVAGPAGRAGPLMAQPSLRLQPPLSRPV